MTDSNQEKQPGTGSRTVSVNDNESLENDRALEKRLVRKTDLLMMPGLGEYLLHRY